MITPALASRRFGIAWLLGMGLGLLYGFLRPLRPRRTVLSDLLFFPAVVWAWVYFSFGLCDGDLRLGYIAGMGLGGIVWEITFGRWMRPVFFGFWGWIGRIWAKITAPFKQIFRKSVLFAKNIFAMGKKWVILKCAKRPKRRSRPGGDSHGKQTELSQPVSAGVQTGLAPTEVRGAGYHRIVYGGTDRPAGGDPTVPQ
jgi:hypothetical protein